MLTMRGPQFLFFFLIVVIGAYVALGIFITSRERERWPGDRRVRDPYTIAFLRGGTRELVQVVTLALAWRGLLQVGTSSLQILKSSAADSVSQPIEKAVLQACRSPAKPTSVVTDSGVSNAANAYERDLQAAQLLADEQVRQARRGPVLTVVAVLCGLAACKVLVALSNGHKNVGLLIILTVISSLVILGKIKERRTSAGDAALRDLTTLFAALKRRRKHSAHNAATDSTMLAAVYGIYRAPGISASKWSKLFARPAGSSSSTSCGSSCGGGSGCGGGGCGGCGS